MLTRPTDLPPPLCPVVAARIPALSNPLVPALFSLGKALEAPRARLESQAAEIPPKIIPDIAQLARDVAAAIVVKDRSYRFKTFKAAFLGTEAVAFLVTKAAAYGFPPYPQSGVLLGN